MLEKQIEAKLARYAKSLGILTYKFTSPSNRGVADRIFIYNGGVMFMEIKTEKGKLTALQTKHGNDLLGAGALYIAVFGYDDGKYILDLFKLANK